jgi:organic hydroperoxide reductase OsmC/OhrA
MSKHRATISWKCTSTDFINGRYSREHTWSFDGGVVVPASPSPSVVPAPWSNPANVDPEEAYVAAVSSCHMLPFGFQVDSYDDEAIGAMTKNERGTPWVSSVTLQPKICYSGSKQPRAG